MLLCEVNSYTVYYGTNLVVEDARLGEVVIIC